MDQLDVDFAELLIRRKLATREQVDECIRIVRKATELGAVTSLPDTMVGKGYLSRTDADALVAQARKRSPKTSIAGYELVSKLGRGGMGVVYKARQVAVDRIVAMKLLRPSLGRNKTYLERFFREARAAAKLNHTNIVHAIDAGSAEGYHYFVMEFVDGPTVAERLKEGPLDETEALRIAHGVALALAHAQRAGIVHRDIKPENIMLTSDGIVKLADLGLAKSFEADSSVTLDGSTLGTPHYMSPEQARGNAELDTRSDIYSLGATLFHMVTSKPPFEGETPAVVASKRLTEPTPSPQDFRPELSHAATRLIRRMMAKDPGRRHQSVGELLADIEAAARGEMARPAIQATARTAAQVPPQSKPARKASTVGLLAGGAVGVAALIVVIWLVTRSPGRPQVSPAEQAQQALAAAMGFREEHPDDLDGAIEELRAVAVKYEGTETAAEANRLADELRRLKANRALAAAVAALRKKCTGLARAGKYGEAIMQVESFAKEHTSDIAEGETATLKREIGLKAAQDYAALVRASDAALAKGDYAGARAALEPAAGFGLDTLKKRAAAKLAEINAHENKSKNLVAWKRIEKRVRELLEAGDCAQAAEVLAQADELPAEQFGKLIEEQARAISQAVEEAEAREAARIEAESGFAAAFDEQVRPLMGGRAYEQAQAALDVIAARPDIKLAAEAIETTRRDLARLMAFWAEVKRRAGGYRAGQAIVIGGKRMKFAKYEDGKLWYSLGRAEVAMDLARMKPRDIASILGAGFPENEELALQYAAFLLLDKDGDRSAAREILATVEQEGDAERYIKLAGGAHDFEAEELEAAKAFAKLQKAAEARPEQVEALLAEFRKSFCHTRCFNEHLFEMEELRGGGAKEDAADKLGMPMLAEDEELRRALLGCWCTDSCRDMWTPDASGRNNHAKVSGTPRFQRGIRKGCVELDRASIEIPYRRMLCPKGSFSVDFCTKASSLRATSYSYYSGPTLVSMGADTYGYLKHDGGFSLRIRSGCLRMELRTGRTSTYYDDERAPLRTNRWCHVAAVLDVEKQEAVVYLNGKKVWRRETTAEIDNTRYQYPIRIGGCRSRRFKGLIDEVHLWAVPLTAQQVGALADGYGLGPGGSVAKVEEARKDSIAENEKRLGEAITWSCKNTPLHYAVVGILNQAEVPYQWERSARAAPESGEELITAQATDLPAAKALEQVLGPLELTYGVDEDGVFLRSRHEPPVTGEGETEEGRGEEAKTIDDRLREPVSLAVPYPEYFKGAPVHQIQVEHAVLDLLNQVGAEYDREASQRNAGAVCQKWITPTIRKLPCRDALNTILAPLGLTYRIDEGKVVLDHK